MSKNASIHPGEILLTEFMKPLGLTASQRIINQLTFACLRGKFA